MDLIAWSGDRRNLLGERDYNLRVTGSRVRLFVDRVKGFVDDFAV